MQTALQKLSTDSKAYKSIERSLKRLGKPGEANGIVVTVGKTDWDMKAVAEDLIAYVQTTWLIKATRRCIS